MQDTDLLPFPLAEDEGRRLTVLHQLGILDTPPDADFDLLTEIAAELCATPYAFVVLVDAERSWIKSAFGLPMQGSEIERGASPCAYAIVQQQPLVVADVGSDPRTSEMPHPHYQMYAGAQLRTSDGITLGTLCVEDTEVRRPSERQLDLLQRLAHQAMQLIELRAARRELQHQAHTDPLTGLANRRALFERLQQEVARSRRHPLALSLVVIDVDHFKAVNDRHGHAVGDMVLQAVADLLIQRSRESDLLARFGGEEFCAVLTDSDLDQALNWAERARSSIEQLRFSGLPDLRITASFGVARLAEQDELTSDVLFSQADQAVYQAKRLGRNRVEASSAAASTADEGQSRPLSEATRAG